MDGAGPWTDISRFREFAGKVAAELGMLLDENDRAVWGTRIESADRLMGYTLSLPNPKDRMTEITPVYPHSTFGWYGTDRGKIRANVTRGHEAVASDIRRKLEPVYLAALANIRLHDAEEARRQAIRADLRDDIEGLFNPGSVVAPSHSQSDNRTILSLPGPGSNGGTVDFQGTADHMQLDRFQAPAGVILAMLAVYATYVREAPEEEWEQWQTRR
jgi:hypothetical protein